MEDGLGPKKAFANETIGGLNPCFNGRWSRTLRWQLSTYAYLFGLNPCFNGRWSRTQQEAVETRGGIVLILVLMEDGLGPQNQLSF